ncbi:adenine deaminase C-terminal domain-containing protein [Conexibacter sp. CPCC 206217]|uniref:adenine deaminase C-terminal domain-containing protein n=1 Tax=Conexibacter sp. CPCC 206217 TaxID=3064574 RepID=UPI00271E4C7A|nr:adenine deaminase C-terminal domain-containing protein [Conexibacter sp. CPCC 206217]MDO8212290.1 adenine deaminase C-terminal domain-containing protein [Conexibacter sp. CPCC 206217]
MQGSKVPDAQERQLLRAVVEVAQGRAHADLIVAGGTVANVFTGELIEADVAIRGHRIAAVGDVARTRGPRTRTLDARGRVLVPGLIDQHLHVHESQLTIGEFAAAALPHGTAGLATDFYGELVVGGIEAVRASVELARGSALKVWLLGGVPGYVQNRPFGHSGRPTREQFHELLRWPETYGISDTFALRLTAGDETMLDVVDGAQAAGIKVSGHGSGVSEAQASAWVGYVRDLDDHESVTGLEAAMKARLGIRVAVREGSGIYNLEAVVEAITRHGADPRRFCFCTDVLSAERLVEVGHIDHLVRKAIACGVAPMAALQMATLNAAECLHVDADHGSIAPGKWADVALVDSLERFEVVAMVADGRLVAQDGALVSPRTPPSYPAWARATVKLPRDMRAEDFRVAVDAPDGPALARVIVASGTTVLSEEAHVRMEVAGGSIAADPARDVLKVAAIERVQGTGATGVGLVRGFGLRSGAIATTFNSQQQNIVAVGAGDGDLALAANTLRYCGGGFVVVDGGEVRALLELPLFGLLSELPFEQVVDGLRAVTAAATALGCEMPEPFSTLGFVGLPVEIGELRLVPEGLVQVAAQRIVPLLVEEDGDPDAARS